MQKIIIIICVLFFIQVHAAKAVRPFITDDARVVGLRYAQLEAWLRFDEHAFQHWNMVAYGPTKWLELSIGGVWGYDVSIPNEQNVSFATPLVQGKFLLRECMANKLPGVAVVAGTFLPSGKGAFKAPGGGAFGFLSVSQSFIEGDKILIHGNVGTNYLKVNSEHQTAVTWGFGTQVHIYKGLHAVGEYFSGDPYVAGAGTAYQAGFRHFINDLIQVDMTVGKGIGGTNPLPFWYSAGIRLVTTKFRKPSVQQTHIQ